MKAKRWRRPRSGTAVRLCGIATLMVV